MIPPKFLTCQEAADHLGSLEALRQTILLHGLRAYVKLNSKNAVHVGSSGDHLAPGETVFSVWLRHEDWFDAQELVADMGEYAQYEPSDDAHDGWDRNVTYTLSGWFLLSGTSARLVALDHPGTHNGAADVAVALDDGSETANESEEAIVTHWFAIDVGIGLNNLWFRSGEIDLMPAPARAKRSGGAMSTREANSMLRIISALAVMAKLPERGAIASVEAQLTDMGFDGPKEATIRHFLAEAREITPPKKGAKWAATTEP